jgi:3-deoxy-D-manno-octulosonate 8-phosphate phosphatase (KDO 8-P phosphatase)
MGDDLPDLDGFKVSGIKACPADAVKEVKQLADYISCKRGGDGCVRDIIEKVMKTQNKWNNSYSVKSI